MRSLMLAGLLCLLTSPALAQVQGGDGNLSGPGVLKVKPDCGRDSEMLTGTWQLTANGGWQALTSGNPLLTGSKSAVGNSGKIWNLAFDASSKLAFDAELAARASALCGVAVTMQPSSVTHFNLKLNKRKTRAKLTLMARGSGSSAAGNGRGAYKAIARGAWSDYLWDATP
jgi:hypothetical protein